MTNEPPPAQSSQSPPSQTPEFLLGHIEIPVSDPLAAREWYERVLGFEHLETQADRFVWMQRRTVGGTPEKPKTSLIGVMLRPGAKDREPPPPTTIGNPETDPVINWVFYTRDLAAAAAHLEANGVKVGEHRQCLHFEDVDGNRFQLVDPGGDHSG